MPVSAEDIEFAANRIGTHIVRTPLVPSPALSQILGRASISHFGLGACQVTADSGQGHEKKLAARMPYPAHVADLHCEQNL